MTISLKTYKLQKLPSGHSSLTATPVSELCSFPNMTPSPVVLHPAPPNNTNVLNRDSPRIQNHRHLWLAKRIHRFEIFRISPSSQLPSFPSSGRSIINATLFAQNTPLLRQFCACPEGSFYLQVVSCSQSLLFCSWKLVKETIKIRDERPICSQSLWKVSNRSECISELAMNIPVRTRCGG